MEQIAIYRQAGLSLQQIKEILDSAKCSAAVSLEAKIDEINEEINILRQQQQQFIIEFLQNSSLLKRIGIIPKDDLVGLLRSAGVDEKGQWTIHNQFEKKFPERHEAFLHPVDWYPWGSDAFAKAKAEDKPIFLSIGYS